jgi:hypothetical protein
VSRLSSAFAVLICGFAALLYAPWLGAASRQDSGYGFSFEVPDDWVQVPQRDLDEAGRRLFKGSVPDNLMILSAWQPKGRPPFTYPYVMVQLVRYPGPHAPTESEMRAMVKDFGKAVTNKTLVGVSREVQEVAKTAQVSDGYFDPFAKKYTMPMEMRVPGAGKVKGKMVGFFGKRHLIQVGCYDRESSFISSDAKFGKILDSFKWDEYSSIPESKVGDKGMIIALGAGAAVVLLVMLLSGGRKAPAGTVIAPKAKGKMPLAEDAPWR